MSRRELEQKLRSWEAGRRRQPPSLTGWRSWASSTTPPMPPRWSAITPRRDTGSGSCGTNCTAGIPRELWDEALEGAADPSAAIEEFLRKKWRGTLPDDPRELKKASDALARRGYSWSDIVEGLRRYGAEAESDE